MDDLDVALILYLEDEQSSSEESRSEESELFKNRHLATGESFRSLAFQYRVYHSWISMILREVVEAIIKRMFHVVLPTPTMGQFKKLRRNILQNGILTIVLEQLMGNMLFFRPISTAPETAEKIIVCACILHNILREAKVLAPGQTYIDSTLPLPVENFFPLTEHNVRGTTNPTQIREMFKNYFNDPVVVE
ncbi:hypothetical protein TNCV_566411 [Trichonephila clavipes]|nr:hypothetical protein TNCV_566411 [Trichonephila clavipes]